MKEPRKLRDLANIFREQLLGSPRVAWIVLLVCLAATTAWWRHTVAETEVHARYLFEQRAREVKSLIDERLDDYKQLLTGTQGLFNALGEVRQAQWHDYIISKDIKREYPGVLAIAYAPYVKETERQAFVRKIRSSGIPDFQITPPGLRPEYAPVIFRESISSNPPKVTGVDQYGDPRRIAVLQRARDNGVVAATGKLIFNRVPAEPAKTGFILYAPVYRKGTHPETVSERQQALAGYVLCPITMKELMKDIFAAGYTDLDLEVFDGTRMTEDAQLYDADLAERMFGPNFHSKYTSRVLLDVFGRTWSLHFSSLPAFEESASMQKPRLVLGFGLLASMLLFTLTWSLATTRAQALSLAASMTSAFTESERKYSSLMEQASDAIFVADQNGKYIDANAKACELLGYTREELLTMHVYDLLLPEDLATDPACLDQLCSGESTIKERQLRRKDGELVPVEISAKLLADGRLQEIVRNISERKKTENRLRQAATVFEAASEGIVISDRNNIILSVNPAFTRITGYPASAVIGTDPKMLRSGTHDAEFYREMWHKIQSEGQWQGEITNRKLSGEVYSEWLSINSVKDVDGNIECYVGVFSDITERKSEAERMRYLAHHDALTGLPNRSLLIDRIEQAIKRARRDNLKFAVMFLDIDRFKSINDTLGHEVGDRVIRHAATCFVECVREGDTVARLGGDEFVIILQDIQSKENLDAVAENILKMLAIPFPVGDHRLALSVSLGIAIYPEEGHDYGSLLKQADIAMYRAKKEGRDVCQDFAEPDSAGPRVT